jgi:hypothetical protein
MVRAVGTEPHHSNASYGERGTYHIHGIYTVQTEGLQGVLINGFRGDNQG